MFATKVIKIAIRRDGKSPDLKVNDKQLQTANLVYIFDEIILRVTASKYGSFPCKVLKGSKVACDTLSRPGIYVYQIHVSSKYLEGISVIKRTNCPL